MWVIEVEYNGFCFFIFKFRIKDEVGFMGYGYKEFGLNNVYDFCWVQHRVRLDSDSLQREGENMQAV